MLDDDIEAVKHLRMNPTQLHKTRDEYKWFKLTNFQCHIEQSIRTSKYKQTLKLKVDDKLKKIMVKYDLGNVDVEEL